MKKLVYTLPYLHNYYIELLGQNNTSNIRHLGPTITTSVQPLPFPTKKPHYRIPASKQTEKTPQDNAQNKQ